MENDLRFEYEGKRDLYWLHYHGQAFSFAGRGFDALHDLPASQLLYHLTAVHPELEHLLVLGDLEKLANAMNTLKAKEAEEFAAFKKQL